MARVSTYLNFPGTTEVAFNYYKSIFGGDFIGGINRFGDMPANPSNPPLSDGDKKLIMHIELAILGGHVIMGTDAVKSMGFSIEAGNNTYINLEPDTRIEAERLFSELTKGGQIEMPLQDMFWGAYFGSCKDQFGIRWMVNCANRK
jgi:PhnB protein